MSESLDREVLFSGTSVQSKKVDCDRNKRAGPKRCIDEGMKTIKTKY